MMGRIDLHPVSTISSQDLPPMTTGATYVTSSFVTTPDDARFSTNDVAPLIAAVHRISLRHQGAQRDYG